MKEFYIFFREFSEADSVDAVVADQSWFLGMSLILRDRSCSINLPMLFGYVSHQGNSTEAGILTSKNARLKLAHRVFRATAVSSMKVPCYLNAKFIEGENEGSEYTDISKSSLGSRRLHGASGGQVHVFHNLGQPLNTPTALTELLTRGSKGVRVDFS